jgi:DNA-binding response OmpR family regulator
MRLLLIEDDEILRQDLKRDLVSAGYAVDEADNGRDGEFMGKVEPYDAIILDLGLPQRPGLEVLSNWRAQGNKIPVIILTARNAWHERVDGFKAGADDYLGKPFHPEELLARISALIKRSKHQIGTLKISGLSLDEERQTVTHTDGATQELTGTEFRLLRYFMLHPGNILSQSTLMEHVYDNDSDKDSNVIEVYVNRLRQKIGKELIKTRRGQGYIFSETD